MNTLSVSESQPLSNGVSKTALGGAEPAKWMKIRVRRNGQTVVELTHAASVVERLSSMLDDNLKQRIGASGVDLEALAVNVRQRGYRSGPLFDMNEGNKEVNVWLE